MIRGQLKGEAGFDWCEAGLVCEITMPELAPAIE
jgi:hypothetical protein